MFLLTDKTWVVLFSNIAVHADEPSNLAIYISSLNSNKSNSDIPFWSFIHLIFVFLYFQIGFIRFTLIRIQSRQGTVLNSISPNR